jgi:hypothetical protein
MSFTKFNCEAGTVLITTCFNECPKGDRCLSIATLRKIGGHKGRIGQKFSTTTLLKPTRQAYLELTTEYAIVPKDRAFMLAGTEHHARIEAVARTIEGVKCELSIPDFEISSTLDNLEPDEKYHGQFKLVDYKLIGSYAVVKMLQGDYSNYDWQLNHYRTQAERLGLKISRLFIQYTARDFTGKTAAMMKDKFTDCMALIEVPKYPDNEVSGLFERKREALQCALSAGKEPDLCDDRWGETKCKKYCDVSINCSHGKLYKKELSE